MVRAWHFLLLAPFCNIMCTINVVVPFVPRVTCVQCLQGDAAAVRAAVEGGTAEMTRCKELKNKLKLFVVKHRLKMQTQHATPNGAQE